MRAFFKIGFVIFFLLVGCNSSNKETHIDPIAYKQEVDEWHQKRIEELKSESGWLNLAGLFWLKEGISTFGSDKSNDLVFPEGKIAAKAGFFLVKNGVVQINVLADVKVMRDSLIVKEEIIFHPDSVKNATLTHGSLQWFVIKRDDRVGIRLRDLQSRGLEEFSGIERYEVDPEWRVEANLEVSSTLRRISITNVLGQTMDQVSPGTLVFEIGGQTYTLDALEGNKEELFIIFGDSTNEKETYPSGRYLYVKIPDANGKTKIDFNKSYNPPCAFTQFATCPLPPSQNVLPIAIRSGEKNYKGVH
ncbi:MAG: DUF1684 domain-containing protein [Cyclobacteriaceae bacterium]